MKLGEKIFRHRRQLGLSQEELAERLGVTRQAVSKWELDSSVPELETVVALARLFGVTADYLLSSEETTLPEANASAEQPKQDWLNRLPGIIGKLLRRFGWLTGIYIAIGGAGFTLLGAMARHLSQKMFSSFHSVENGITNMSGMDISGNFFGPFFDTYNHQVSAIVKNNPVTIIGTFVMVSGLILLAGGIVLAIWLKKKFSDTSK